LSKAAKIWNRLLQGSLEKKFGQIIPVCHWTVLPGFRWGWNR